MYLQINGSEICSTVEHPFWHKEKGWIKAGELLPGDTLKQRDGEYVKVTYICQKKAKEQRVYNLEVEGLHTYYVAEGELLVHNGEGVCPEGKVKIESAGESGSGSTTDVRNIIDSIPDKLKTYGKCDGFAQSLVNSLDKKGVPYKIIRVDSEFEIFSDKAGASIGKGFHYGVQIGNVVYDNMTINGMEVKEWLTDLGLTQGYPGIKWDYVDTIISH